MNKNSIKSPQKNNGYEMVNVNMDLNSEMARPLIEAAKYGDLNALEMLLDKGEDILQIDQGGRTALHLVAYLENFDTAICCTEILLSKARQNSNPNLLSKFLNIEDIKKWTALRNATVRGNHKLMEILLENGTNLSVTDNNETPFHILAKSENHVTDLQCAIILMNLKYYENDFGKLKDYLNIEDRYTKRTAIHFAGIYGKHDLMETYIRNGADATKEDYVKCNIFHHAVGNAFEEKAVACTQTLLQQDFTPGWKKNIPILLESMDNCGRCPIHIAAKRGFHEILGLLSSNYALHEAGTGVTPLHSAASLGDEDQAELCVKKILSSSNEESRRALCNAEDAEGRTPLYMSAKERNVEACKLLLLAGSGFDIPNKRGKTPLEKVYQKIPQAVSVLLEQSVKNSGYVAYFRTINTVAEIDFGPILGYSTSKSSVYKETEELAKVCKAKFSNRKTVLYHPFVQIYIHQKWEKVKWFFHIFRLFHIIWFFLNCIFVVWMYRYVCPLPGAKNFTWEGLRPEDGEAVAKNDNKTLHECEITSGLYCSGILNLITLFVYIICQLHETKQKFHQIFRPAKINPKHNFVTKAVISIFYNLKLLFEILPCGPIVIGAGILFSTLPTIGIQPFSDFCHYFIAAMVALGVWAAICLEAMKIPRFSFYKNLLWKSAKTLLVAITVTAPILFGFAALFAILIPGEPAFSSPAQSLVKVITFMIGELDYGSLVYGETESVFLGWVMLFMALFVVIIVVLLVNFLIGLAAEEISDVWDRAVIWSLCTKLEEIYALESLLDEKLPICERGFLRKHLMFMPPDTEDGIIVKQSRRARIKIPDLPKDLQKEFHQLRLKTILEVKQL